MSCLIKFQFFFQDVSFEFIMVWFTNEEVYSLTYNSTFRLPVAGKEKEIPKSLQTSPSNSKINLNVLSTPAPGTRVSDINSANMNKRASFVEVSVAVIVIRVIAYWFCWVTCILYCFICHFNRHWRSQLFLNIPQELQQ